VLLNVEERPETLDDEEIELAFEEQETDFFYY
jgi:hypothetical protein